MRKFSPYYHGSYEVVAHTLKKNLILQDDSNDGFLINGEVYIHVFIDESCLQNRKESSRARIGVWFNKDHPINVLNRSMGKHTNNAAEIEAVITGRIQAIKANKETENTHGLSVP